jgi:CheY-like chemotaxis protein
MDQEMPVKDGNTAAREIKDLQARHEVGRSPILGVSANVREEQTRVMKEAGMDEVISKPFKVKDLVRKIDFLAETIAGKEDDT